jgi:FKBP-type peptidyl-prolyl cis-trans isomerase SlyD
VTITTIEPNRHVTLDYVLKDDAGEILDESKGEGGEPIEYVHGYGMLVPGLEAALAGMKTGESKEITVTAEEGFGDRDDELMLEIDREEFPDPKVVKEGDEFVAESPDGDEVVMRVVEVKGDTVVVDANHPLAGVTLHYSVNVREVREATAQEIEDAAADLDEAHQHVHGPDCDHDHDHGVVTLGKKGEKKPDLPN